MCLKKPKTASISKQESPPKKEKKAPPQAQAVEEVPPDAGDAPPKVKSKPKLESAPVPEPRLLDILQRRLWPNVGAYEQEFRFRLAKRVEDMMDYSFDYGAPRLMRDCHRILMEQGNALNAAPTAKSELVAAEFNAAQQLESTNVPEAMLAGLRDCQIANICEVFDVVKQRLYISDRSLALLLLRHLVKFSNFGKNVEEFASLFFQNVTNENAMRARHTMSTAEQENVVLCLNKTIEEYSKLDSTRSQAASNCHVALIFEFAYWAAELRGHTNDRDIHEGLASQCYVDDKEIDYAYLHYIFDCLGNKDQPMGPEGNHLCEATKLMLFLSRYQTHVNLWGDEHKRKFTKAQPRFFNILDLLYLDLKAVEALSKPPVFEWCHREYQLLHRLVLYSRMGCDMQPFFYQNSMSHWPKQLERPPAINQALRRPDVVNYLLYYYSIYCHLSKPGQGVLPHVVRQWIIRGQFRRRDGSVDIVPIQRMTWGIENSKSVFRSGQNLAVLVRLIRDVLSHASVETTVRVVDHSFVTARTDKHESALLKEQLIHFFGPIMLGGAEQIHRQLFNALIEHYHEVVPKRDGLSIRGPYLPKRKEIEFSDVVQLEE